jgi:uncharacterized protein (DUF1800 family)
LFDDYIHATGKVTVLGFTNANTNAAKGEAAGDAMLRYLAAHPYTAQNLARKLCLRFVSDNPSSDLVAAVAQAYLDNNTQILPMVKTILCSTEFWESRGLKTRRPADNLVAAVRALGVVPLQWDTALQTMRWMSYVVGQAPGDWPAPNGYPDVAASWRSSSVLLQLWDYHLCFAGQWANGFVPGNILGLYKTIPITSGQAIDQLTNRLTGTTFAPADRQALLTFVGDPSFDTLMALSGIQWYGGYLLGLILHSPYHALH